MSAELTVSYTHTVQCRPCCLTMRALRCRACAKRKSSGSEPHEWCCSLDADLNLLLTCEEMETYHQRVCPAAALRSQELKPCPQTDCTGLAVTQPGGPLMSSFSRGGAVAIDEQQLVDKPVVPSLLTMSAFGQVLSGNVHAGWSPCLVAAAPQLGRHGGAPFNAPIILLLSAPDCQLSQGPPSVCQHHVLAR